MLNVPPVIVVLENKLNAQLAGKDTKADWVFWLIEVTLAVLICELLVEDVAEGAAKRFEIDFCWAFDRER